MFAIDTGSEGGSQGPWISWTSNGSAMKSFAPKSWVLRGKDDADVKFERVIEAFTTGCIMDLDTLKLGWEKEGATGQAPERRWNASIAQSTPRPDESKTHNGKLAWSASLSVRCAIGGGQCATWEQAAFGAYDAFAKLSKQIEAEWTEKSDNGRLLPLIKQTGTESQTLAAGTSNKPVLTVVQWVERPDCLKANAPTIATDTSAADAAAAKAKAASDAAAALAAQAAADAQANAGAGAAGGGF